MRRKYIECHEQDFPGAPKCTARFSAESEDELLEMAVRHGMNIHGHANTESYRKKIRGEFRDGTPARSQG